MLQLSLVPIIMFSRVIEAAVNDFQPVLSFYDANLRNMMDDGRLSAPALMNMKFMFSYFLMKLFDYISQQLCLISLFSHISLGSIQMDIIL